MTSFFRTSIAAGVLCAFALSAFANATGSVTSATEEVGSVVVQRGTEIISIGSGAELLDGDIVQTRAAGTATITAYGCTVELKALESVKVDAQFCKAVIAKLDASGVAIADAGVAGGGVGAAVGLTAAAAAAAVAAGAGGASSP